MSMILNLLRVSPAALDEYLEDSSLLEDQLDLMYETDDERFVDIEKAWNGIFFLLTGGNMESFEHPLAKAIYSGLYIDEDQDLGYGPACFNTVDDVKEVAAALDRLTRDELNVRYDPHRMEQLQIYPSIWEEGQEAFDYLWHYFTILSGFYKKAAAEEQAVISFIS